MNKFMPLIVALLIGAVVGYVVGGATARPEKEVQVKEVVKKEMVFQHSECGTFTNKK